MLLDKACRNCKSLHFYTSKKDTLFAVIHSHPKISQSIVALLGSSQEYIEAGKRDPEMDMGL